MLNQIVLIIGVIVGIVKAIAALVELVEVPGQGEQKKQAVLDLLGVIYDEVSKITALPITKERLLAIASNLIDIIVKIYNTLGLFQTRTNA